MRQHVFEGLAGDQLGDGALQRGEPSLEEPGSHLEVLGAPMGVVDLLPPHAIDALVGAVELAALFDHVSRGVSEHARQQREHRGRVPAVLLERRVAVVEPLADQPLVRPDLLRRDLVQRRHRVRRLRDRRVEGRGGAERLQHVGEVSRRLGAVDPSVGADADQLAWAADGDGGRLEQPTEPVVRAPVGVVTQLGQAACLTGAREGRGERRW